VTRVAREVGTEGKLGGQARVIGGRRKWKDLTDNVNFMAGNLTGQVRNIAEVTTAVANATFPKKITVDVKAKSSNSKTPSTPWWTSLHCFASEVTRVGARSVRKENSAARLRVKGVAGTWKDLTGQRELDGGNLTARCATSPKSRPPSPTATFPEDHPT